MRYLHSPARCICGWKAAIRHLHTARHPAALSLVDEFASVLSNQDKVRLLFSKLLFFAVAILLGLGCPLSANNQTPAVPNDQGWPVLVRGATTAHDMAGGTSQDFSILLSSGEYFRIVILRRDLNLAVTLYGPDEQQCGWFKSDHYGSLRVSHVAEATGRYRLRISSLETGATRGRYDLLVEELRRATIEDRKDDAATRDFYEAERLCAEWVESSTETAINKYGEAFTLWQSAGRPDQGIEALTRIGEAYFTLSDYAQSLLSYQKALDLSRSARVKFGEAIASNGIGSVYERIGKEDQALIYFQRVVARYDGDRSPNRSPQDRSAEAQAFCNSGVVHYSRGNLRYALQLFQRALDISSEIGDLGGQAFATLNRGHAYSDSGDLEKAAVDFGQALLLSRSTGDRSGEAFALMALGGNHSFFGRTELARESQRQALQLFRVMGDRHGEAVALNGVARIYEGLNELQTSIDLYSQALAIFQKNNTKEFAAATEYSIGAVYRRMDQIDSSLAHYQQSIALSRLAGKRRLEAYALMDIATIHTAQGETRRAFSQYKQILQLYREIGDKLGQAKVIKSIGDIYYMSGDGALALKYYRQALPLYQMAKNNSGEASTLYSMGRAARAGGDLKGALSYLGSAIKIIEFLRVQIASPALRSSYYASVRKYHGLYIDLLMQLHASQAEEGFAARAFEASENARARVLLETLAESAANIRQGINPDLLDHERSLQRTLSNKALYQSRLLSNRDTEHESDEVAQEIRQLSADYEEVEAQIRKQSPRYASLTQPQPFRLGDIQQELGKETVLLEYILGDEKSYLWAVSSTSIESFELPNRSAMETAAREIYSCMVARQPVPGEAEPDRQSRFAKADALYAQRSADLSRILLGPVSAQLGNKRILIVADGALQYVSFEALPDLSRRPVTVENTDNKDLAPLVLNHEIVYLPSASALIALRHERASQPPIAGLVAVLADPVFERDDPRIKGLAAPIANGDPTGQSSSLQEALRDGSRSGALRLPYTLREANEIAALVPSGSRMIATGFNANRATATSPQLGQYQIVHFATHGIANDKHPELSGIVLSLFDEQGRPEEGFLQLHDIYNLNLSATLIVLSACDTGLGKDVNGEGLVGITRGFMYAGSKSVLASLWKVDDRATAELMSRFYRKMLKDGEPPAAALRAAKIEMSKQEQWGPPYYWAAFVLQGDYAQAIAVPHTTQNSLGRISLPIIMFALLVSSYFVVRRLRKRSRSMQ